MKAQELRIGNWVWNDVQNLPVKVDIRILNQQYSADRGIGRSWNPIPLTEEILLKCGFVRRGITSNNGSKLTLHHKDYMYTNGRVYWNSWCILDSIPEHLHQLQNLYYALTGEELEVKL